MPQCDSSNKAVVDSSVIVGFILLEERHSSRRMRQQKIMENYSCCITAVIREESVATVATKLGDYKRANQAFDDFTIDMPELAVTSKSRSIREIIEKKFKSRQLSSKFIKDIQIASIAAANDCPVITADKDFLLIKSKYKKLEVITATRRGRWS